MPRREMSAVVAIVVVCVMLFSAIPFGGFASSEIGSRTIGPVETGCDGGEASPDLQIVSVAGTSDVGESMSSESQVESKRPGNPWGQSFSSEALPEEYIIESWPGDDLSMVGHVPYYLQGAYPRCGQYSVTEVLNWLGEYVSAWDVIERVGDGYTHLDQLEFALASFLGKNSWHTHGGFDSASEAVDWVKYTISCRIPVIAQIHSFGSSDDWANHFVTIVGYNSTCWYLHDTARNYNGGWHDGFDVNATFDFFELLWNYEYSTSSGYWGVRGVVAADRYWGDYLYPSPRVYTLGDIPDVYDDCQDSEPPYTVEVALANMGNDGGTGGRLRVEVVGAKIQGFAIGIGVWDSYRTMNLAGNWGTGFPASVVEFSTSDDIPVTQGGDAGLKAKIYLYPTASSQLAHLGHVLLNGSIVDEDDWGRSGSIFIDDDSDRYIDPETGTEGVLVVPAAHRIEFTTPLKIVSYSILDDDTAPPTIHDVGVLCDTIYDCNLESIEFHVEASDASGIYSADFMYGLSDTDRGYSSGWLPATLSWIDESDPSIWHYTYAIPREVWIDHVGAYARWKVLVVDADCDMDRIGDRSQASSGDMSEPLCPHVSIEDDDPCGPTFSLPTHSYDYVPESESFRVWAEVSDPSGISLARINYRFSDSGWSDWIDATEDGGLYSVCIPPEIWEPHAGEVIYWQAYAEDGDSDRPGDLSSSLSTEFSAMLAAYLTVNNGGHGTTYGTGWHASGTSATFGVDSTTVREGCDAAWTYTTGSSVYSSPAVANGIVYVGSDDMMVYAFDAADGTLLWSTMTGGSVDSSPAVADGIVYVGSLYRIIALNAADGTLVWSYTTGGVVWSSPAVVDGKVYVGSWDGKVYALNAADGTLAWCYPTGSSIWSSPAVTDGKVYIGSWDGRVYALNAADGTLEWSYATGGGIRSSPAVENGMVYIGSEDHRVYALDAVDGSLVWSYATGNAVRSSPAVSYGMVFVASEDGNTYALKAADGALVWSYGTSWGVSWSSPTVAGGMVYIGSYDNRIYAFNAADGTLAWSYATGNHVLSTPAVADGHVYVGSFDNKVYALTGEVWYIFTGWSGDSSSTSQQDTILMDGPKTVTANWEAEATMYLLSPNRGEDIEWGSTYAITWSWEGGHGNVNIYLVDYSKTPTSTTSIATDIPNTGRYLWKVTGLPPGDQFKVVIRAGANAHDQSDAFFAIRDSTAPSISITSPTDGLLTNQDVLLQYTVVDGCSAPECIVITGPPTGTTYTSEGNYMVTISAVDEAGNIATTTVSFTIDKTLPWVDCTVEGLEWQEGWYRTDVTVALAAHDDVATILKVSYILTSNGIPGPVVTSAEPGVPVLIELLDDGMYTIEYYTVDSAGNEAVHKSLTFGIDRVRPSTTSALSGTGAGGWYRSDVEVTLTPYDGLSGVWGTAIVENGGVLEWYTGPRIYVTEGPYLLEYYSIDNSGNTELTQTVSFWIDKTAPWVEYSVSGEKGKDIWYRSDVDITFTPYDDVSVRSEAVCIVTYCGSDKPTSEPALKVPGSPTSVCLKEEGVYTIEYYVTDSAGNEATHQFLTIGIDKTPPTIYGSPTTQSNEHGWWNCEVMVQFNAVDNDEGSGIDPTTLTPDQILTGEGVSQSVMGTVIDMAGNMATVTIGNINIDTTAPVTTLTIGDPNYGVDPTYVTDLTTFTLGATDSMSGIWTTEYRFDDDQTWTLYGGPFVQVSKGTHTLRYRSTDMAENAEAEQSTQFVVNAVVITYIGELAGQYSDLVTVSAELVELSSMSPIGGRTVTFSIGDQIVTAATNQLGVASATIVLSQPAGSYAVTAEFAGDDVYIGGATTASFQMDLEDAVLDYTGSTVIPTTSTTIWMRVTVYDAQDGSRGDLTKLTITMKIFAIPLTSTPLMVVSHVPVMATDDAGVGVAEVASIPINLQENSYLIEIELDTAAENYYQAPSTSHTHSPLTIYFPSPSSFTYGAGEVNDPTAGSGDFSFNVRYLKGSIKGSSVYIYMADGFEYIIKDSAWLGFAIEGKHAYFESKCVVQKYDPSTGLVVWSEGNYKMRVDTWDNSKGGGTDSYWLRVLNKNGVAYHTAGGTSPLGNLLSGQVVVVAIPSRANATSLMPPTCGLTSGVNVALVLFLVMLAMFLGRILLQNQGRPLVRRTLRLLAVPGMLE